MLRNELLNYSVRDGDVVPRYLGFNDIPWLRTLIDEVERFSGHREAELDERLRFPIADGVDPRKQRLAVRVIRSMMTTRSRGFQAKQVRARLFEAAAATDVCQDTVILGVANDLGISVDDLRSGLFGDIPGQRIVTFTTDSLSPNELALRANLALARGLVERASVVSIELEGNARAVVRQAKLRRLICAVRGGSGENAVLEVSGPFALFRHTLLYGRALGELLPFLVWCRRFRLRATCVLGERSLQLRLASGDPIFPSAAPRRFDSKVEERFFRDFSRIALEWDVIREPEPVRAGVSLLFPDFLLQHRQRSERRWFLEIVGFWTPRYLERKLEGYRAAAIQNLILCVADDLACSESDFPTGAHMFRYHRVVDARLVFDVIQSEATNALTSQC